MKCIFCGKSAGFFKKEHSECRIAAENGKKYLRECIDYIYENRDCMNITDVVADTIARFNIPIDMVQKLFLECWNAKVLDAFSDGIITSEEIKILRDIMLTLKIDERALVQSKQWQMLISHGKKSISDIIDLSIQNEDFSTVKKDIAKVAATYGFNESDIKQCALLHLKSFLDAAFENGILEKKEELLLNKLVDTFEFSDTDIDPFRIRIVKGAILRDVLEGIIPQRLEVAAPLPVLLQKNETIIWLCNHVEAYEDKTRRHYVGGSAGVSFRVAKGVYLRSGSFKGRPVETTETVSIGTGSLIITNKTIFWISSVKSIKLSLKKIISVLPYSDGIVLQKDGATAKPLTLRLDDPWFISNLISNLNLLQ